MTLRPKKQSRKVINFKNRVNRNRRKVEKLARKALESGNVVILVDVEVPNSAVTVLSKGLGFVPTPTVDIHQTRLDLRLAKNRIIRASKKNLRDPLPASLDNEPDHNTFSLPSKLARIYYGTVSPTRDQPVNELLEQIEVDLDARLSKPRPPTPKVNLSKAENLGLKWLIDKTTAEEIAIVPADKGDAILIVDPIMLKRKVLEKLEDPTLYQKIPGDPTKDLSSELYQEWVNGKTEGHVTAEEAKKVMGVSDNMKGDGSGPTNRQSTLPHFRAGHSYFYPSLKIHKLKPEELVPGAEAPIRLITALQDGVTKRSDVFLASKYLKQLEKDSCGDLVGDTTEALKWLDSLNGILNPSYKRLLKSFTFDYKALYDSLSPNLVKEALEHAMDKLRPNWSPDLRQWIMKLVDLSLRASVGTFGGAWYIQLNGVPTGGTLCVQLANMAVYYVMSKVVYSNPTMMKRVTSLIRFIDDGAGFFEGSRAEFQTFIDSMNCGLAEYGLHVDEFSFEEPSSYVAFLDIKFCFDNNGDLQTDLHTKETDARNYLHFSSSHPDHVYSGVVYSQALRLRRIINSTERLSVRLDELIVSFIECGYPVKMLNNICKKVRHSERLLFRVEPEPNDEVAPDRVRLISTYGSDGDIVSSVKKFEEDLSRTRSFSESNDVSPSPTSTPSKKPRIMQFVKRTGASLASQLVKVKNFAVGNKYGKTRPCFKKNCKCCQLISGEDSMTVNGTLVKAAPGICTTYNIIYMFICNCCSQVYIGRSVRPLNTRTGEHRRKFYELLGGKKIDPSDDEYSLGLHLFDHGFRERTDFNDNFRVMILDITSPKSLEVKEHKYIHLLNTLKPNGINTMNPFGIRILKF